MTEPTTLVLSGIGVPPYSARGLQQTYEPIDQASQLRRNLNGNLVDLSAIEFHKYKSTITGSDQSQPAVDGVWPGQVVTVDCIFEFCYPEYGVAQRPAVEGSEREEAGFVFYRPRLTMMVTNFNVTTDEYQATVGWQMTLEESTEEVS